MSYARNLATIARSGIASFDTPVELRAANLETTPLFVQTLGALAAGDNGGGLWRWDAASTEDEDMETAYNPKYPTYRKTAPVPGTVVLPTGHVGPGRWKRVIEGDTVLVDWWGVQDWPVDCSGAFTMANKRAWELGLRRVTFAKRRKLAAYGVVLASNLEIDLINCEIAIPDTVNPSNGTAGLFVHNGDGGCLSDNPEDVFGNVMNPVDPSYELWGFHPDTDRNRYQNELFEEFNAVYDYIPGTVDFTVSVASQFQPGDWVMIFAPYQATTTKTDQGRGEMNVVQKVDGNVVKMRYPSTKHFYNDSNPNVRSGISRYNEGSVLENVVIKNLTIPKPESTTRFNAQGYKAFNIHHAFNVTVENMVAEFQNGHWQGSIGGRYIIWRDISVISTLPVWTLDQRTADWRFERVQATQIDKLPAEDPKWSFHQQLMQGGESSTAEFYDCKFVYNNRATRQAEGVLDDAIPGWRATYGGRYLFERCHFSGNALRGGGSTGSHGERTMYRNCSWIGKMGRASLFKAQWGGTDAYRRTITSEPLFELTNCCIDVEYDTTENGANFDCNFSGISESPFIRVENNSIRIVDENGNPWIGRWTSTTAFSANAGTTVWSALPQSRLHNNGFFPSVEKHILTPKDFMSWDGANNDKKLPYVDQQGVVFPGTSAGEFVSTTFTAEESDFPAVMWLTLYLVDPSGAGGKATFQITISSPTYGEPDVPSSYTAQHYWEPVLAANNKIQKLEVGQYKVSGAQIAADKNLLLKNTMIMIKRIGTHVNDVAGPVGLVRAEIYVAGGTP